MNNLIGSEFTGNVWENGEFGVAASKTTNKLMPKHTDKVLRKQEDVDWILNIIKVHGVEAALWYSREYLCLPSEDGCGRIPNEGAIYLGLSTLPNSHKRTPRGEKGITTYGKRLVRNACHRLEKEHPKELLTFLTVTLPDVTVAESVEITRNWAEVVRQFQQSLKRLLQSAGLSGEIVGVTELQLKRYQSTGVFALHLHLVFQGRQRYGSWVLSPSLVRRAWSRSLSKYLTREVSSYKWDCCENLQHVKKSVEQYLGKYLSKGCQDIQKIHAADIDYVFPSSWYLCSLSLRERVHNRVIKLSGHPASHLVDMASSSVHKLVFEYKHPVLISTDGSPGITIGWYGRLTREGYSYMNDLFIEHAIERDTRLDKFLTV